MRRFVKYNLGEGMEKREEDFAAEVEAQTKALAEKAAEKKEEAPKEEEAKPAEEEAKPAVAVSAKQVKELRDKSGAGMMVCKKALQECGGDVEEATNWLRKKGMASADKKASRIAAEGAIAQYIHAGARLGVLVEVNCETTSSRAATASRSSATSPCRWRPAPRWSTSRRRTPTRR